MPPNQTLEDKDTVDFVTTLYTDIDELSRRIQNLENSEGASFVSTTTCLMITVEADTSGAGVTAAGTPSNANLRVFYQPWTPRYTWRFRYMDLYISGAAPAGDSICAGIYTHTGTLIAQTNTLSSVEVVGAGVYTFDLGSVLEWSFGTTYLVAMTRGSGSWITGITSWSSLAAHRTGINNLYGTPCYFWGANAAVEAGGAGSAITMPAAAGARTDSSGVAASLLPLFMCYT